MRPGTTTLPWGIDFGDGLVLEGEHDMTRYLPHYGIDGGKTLAERLVWIPFGGASIVALWWLTGILVLRLVRR